MARREKPLLTWVYDTREQRPYGLALPDNKFFRDGGEYETTLAEGDTTCDLDGERLPIILERKQLNDFLACCGRERERFDNELARLNSYRWAHVIIESPYAQIRAGSRYSGMNGEAAWHSILHWTLVYPMVHWHCVTNRVEGQVCARVLLQEAAKHYFEG